MPADFLSGLRMDAMYPPTSGGINVDDISRLLGHVMPYVQQERDKERMFQSNIMAQQRADRIAEIGRAMAHPAAGADTTGMNVRFQPPMTPYEQATVDLKRQELSQKGEIAGGKLGLGKEQLAEKTAYGAGKLGIEGKKVDVAQRRNDIADFKAKNSSWKWFTDAQGNVTAADPLSGKTQEFGPVGLDREEINALNQDAVSARDLANIKARGEVQKDVLAQAGTQRLGQIGAQQAAAAQKAQQLTTSTRTMMEGAQMLRPHVNELRQQATELDKRNLFGPAMSRIRELASKIGTTGSPEEVQNNLDTFSQALLQDPKLSTDRAVGQFATTLGLMASGAGRVHGGARGGGSIQLVNYMKSLLSSDSTLDMFNGRLDGLDSFMKGYAAGPAPSQTAPSDNQDKKLDDALGNIFGGAADGGSDAK